jgi:hypothetical protein
MVNQKICDAKDNHKTCGKPAFHTVDVCLGWLDSREESGKPKQFFKPFEEGVDVAKLDLCEKHYQKWLRATYEAVFGKVGSAQYE